MGLSLLIGKQIMTDVFVAFGSGSDKSVYEPLLAKFKNAGISYEFKVSSAHKTPKELKSDLIDTNASIFVAGAGLSAALPGVIASEQVKPVVGLPCDGAFQGIDSFLSSTQMPPDIPVIGVGVGNTSAAVTLCSNYLHGMNEIVLVKKTKGLEKKYFEKCKKFMEENKIPFTIENSSKEENHSRVFIEFNELGTTFKDNRNIVIRCLVTEKSTLKDSIQFFESLQESYSVALNSYKNAAIAALELINLKREHSNLLVEMRKKAAQKVLDSNK